MQQVSVPWIQAIPLGKGEQNVTNGTLSKMRAWTRCICLKHYTDVRIVKRNKNLGVSVFSHTRPYEICSHTKERSHNLRTISLEGFASS